MTERTRAYRIAQEQKHNVRKKHLLSVCRGYPQPYGEMHIDIETKNGIEHKIWYKKYNLGRRYTQLKRKDSNIAIRNYKGYIANGSAYKRIFDLWYNAF